MSRYAHLAERAFGAPLFLTQDAAGIVADYLFSRINGTANDADIPAQFLARPIEQQIAGSSKKPYLIDQGVAVVGISGKLLNRGSNMDAISGISSYEYIVAQLKAAEADPAVNGIMLEIDSPGGEVAGVDIVTRQMSAMQKPIWAIGNSMAASAAYWIGAGASRFAMIENGVTGSIGAVIVLRDLTKAMDRAGVGATIIRSGSQKMLGSGMEPISPDLVERMQGLVDKAANGFIAHVAQARGVSEKAIRALEGATLDAQEAKAARLIDTISTVSDFHLSMVAAMRKGTAGSAGKKSTAPANSPTLKGTIAMSSPTYEEIQQQAKDEAIAKATADGAKAGATQERARISAILDSEEAKGRTKLAAHIAFKTAMSADEAKAMLSASAVDSPAASAVAPDAAAAAAATAAALGASTNLLDAAMSAKENQNVDVGVGAAKPSAADLETPEAKAAAVVARNEARLGKPLPGIR